MNAAFIKTKTRTYRLSEYGPPNSTPPELHLVAGQSAGLVAEHVFYLAEVSVLVGSSGQSGGVAGGVIHLQILIHVIGLFVVVVVVVVVVIVGIDDGQESKKRQDNIYAVVK